MKLNSLIFLFCLLSVWACTDDQAKITFCTELTDQETCAATQDTFPAYQRVYFSCQSKVDLPLGQVKGVIYQLTEGSNKKYIGEHLFDVTPNTKSLQYYIPFEMYGGYGDYLVEISGPDGALIAADQLYIQTQ